MSNAKECNLCTRLGAPCGLETIKTLAVNKVSRVCDDHRRMLIDRVELVRPWDGAELKHPDGGTLGEDGRGLWLVQARPLEPNAPMCMGCYDGVVLADCALEAMSGMRDHWDLPVRAYPLPNNVTMHDIEILSYWLAYSDSRAARRFDLARFEENENETYTGRFVLGRNAAKV